jgi:hypothetical protein
MFERFTDRARRVVVLAQEEARMLDHNYIGTEHMLLGLLHEGEGVAAKALEALDVDLEETRAWIVNLIGRGQSTPSGHIPFTPRGKKVMELALREALQLGHNYIGTEHILLALVREGEGVGAQALQGAGVTLDDARITIKRILDPSAPTVNFSTGDEDQAVFPSYSTDGCPKCHNANVKAVYQPPKAHYSKVLKRVWALGEHMRRSCRECSYEWAEACRTNLMAPGASWTAEQDLNERIKALQKEAEQSESTPAE